MRDLATLIRQNAESDESAQRQREVLARRNREAAERDERRIAALRETKAA